MAVCIGGRLPERIVPLQQAEGDPALGLWCKGWERADGEALCDHKVYWFLNVGAYVGIGEQVWIENMALVSIGDQVTPSQGAMLMTGNHDYTSPSFELTLGPIVVESGAWICVRALVCPGVRIGSHAVLGAGSVATCDLQEYTIHSGHPAAPRRERVLRT